MTVRFIKTPVAGRKMHRTTRINVTPGIFYPERFTNYRQRRFQNGRFFVACLHAVSFTVVYEQIMGKWKKLPLTCAYFFPGTSFSTPSTLSRSAATDQTMTFNAENTSSTSASLLWTVPTSFKYKISSYVIKYKPLSAKDWFYTERLIFSVSNYMLTCLFHAKWYEAHLLSIPGERRLGTTFFHTLSVTGKFCCEACSAITEFIASPCHHKFIYPYIHFVSQRAESRGGMLGFTENLPKTEPFDLALPVRTAQANHNRYFWQMHKDAF